MVKKLSQKDECVDMLKQIASTQKIVMQTFFLENNVIILPGVNKRFYFTEDYFKELRENRNLLKFDQKSLILFNLVKIDDGYANIGAVCVLEEEKNNNKHNYGFCAGLGNMRRENRTDY